VDPEVERLLAALDEQARVRAASFVYFIGPTHGKGPVKIGYAKHPARRLKDLQVGSPVPLCIYALAEGGNQAEQSFHKIYASERLHGEWFRCTPRLLERIVYQQRLMTRDYFLATRRITRRLLTAAGEGWEPIAVECGAEPIAA
jgi:hypothetical protein